MSFLSPPPSVSDLQDLPGVYWVDELVQAMILTPNWQHENNLFPEYSTMMLQRVFKIVTELTCTSTILKHELERDWFSLCLSSGISGNVQARWQSFGKDRCGVQLVDLGLCEKDRMFHCSVGYHMLAILFHLL